MIRKGTIKDSKHFLSMLDAFATFESLKGPDRGAKRRIVRDVFSKKVASLLVALYGGEYAGFATYFYTYSTFAGTPILYLEDIFVLEDYRRRGVGRALFVQCAKEAVKHGCGKMEWQVLTWNRKAMDFYESFGGARADEWCVYGLNTGKLTKVAKGRP